MKKAILFILFAVSLSCGGQNINISNLGSLKVSKSDSIGKTILEPTQYIATYSYKYVRDAQCPDDVRNTTTILQIGNCYNRFCDYNILRYDSICDEGAHGQTEVSNMMSEALYCLRNTRFKESIVVDKGKQTETIQRTIGTKKYQYDEAVPIIEWELLEGDTVISQHKCNKAKGWLFGREYIAWYAQDVAIPFGPYKFSGLPGLIFKITDTSGHHDFTLNGLQKANKYQPLYMWNNKKIIKSNRKTVRQIYMNYCLDPVGMLTADGNIQISESDKSKVKQKPYNPIELE